MDIYTYETNNKVVKYTSDDLLQGEPCYILGCGLIYPLKIKGYLKFLTDYGTYFMLSEEALNKQLPNLEGNRTVLDKIMIYNGLIKSQVDVFGKPKMDLEMAMKEILTELENAFSIVSRKQIKYNETENSFSDDKRSIVINHSNLNDVRKVIAMQNLIKEPIIYEDAEYAELMAEARRQKSKRSGGGIGVSEIIAYVKNYGKLKYEDVYDQNVLQLYSDYHTMSQMESYRTVMNFKLVTSEAPDVSLAEQFIESLFRPEDDSDLLIEQDSVFK